jgi:hypothetical protein
MQMSVLINCNYLDLTKGDNTSHIYTLPQKRHLKKFKNKRKTFFHKYGTTRVLNKTLRLKF